MSIETVGLLLFSPGTSPPFAVPGWPEGVLSILYLAIFGTFITFVGYVHLLRRPRGRLP